jgi:hypothetical protein
MTQEDKDRLVSSLQEAILLLCKTGLRFRTKVSVDGLIGITLDDGNVFLVKISEVITSDQETVLTDGSTACSRDQTVVSHSVQNLMHSNQSDVHKSQLKCKDDRSGSSCSMSPVPGIASIDKPDIIDENAAAVESRSDDEGDMIVTGCQEELTCVRKAPLPVLNIPNAPRRLLNPRSSTRRQFTSHSHDRVEWVIS